MAPDPVVAADEAGAGPPARWGTAAQVAVLAVAAALRPWITVYSAGPAARSAHPDAARAFVAFLTRPAFKAKFAAAGLDYKP